MHIYKNSASNSKSKFVSKLDVLHGKMKCIKSFYLHVKIIVVEKCPLINYWSFYIFLPEMRHLVNLLPSYNILKNLKHWSSSKVLHSSSSIEYNLIIQISIDTALMLHCFFTYSRFIIYSINHLSCRLNMYAFRKQWNLLWRKGNSSYN